MEWTELKALIDLGTSTYAVINPFMISERAYNGMGIGRMTLMRIWTIKVLGFLCVVNHPSSKRL